MNNYDISNDIFRCITSLFEKINLSEDTIEIRSRTVNLLNIILI